MNRHVIAKEGMPSILPDTWLDKGSLWMDPEEEIYVTANFDWEKSPIGYAIDLQRNEETGEVSVEIHLYDGATVDEELYECSFWATELQERQVEATDEQSGYRLILKAHVRGIAMVPIAANPKSASQKLQAT
jgi:hypothetical protein